MPGPAAVTDDLLPDTDQLVETTTVKGHTWKTDDYSVETLP